jgi:hypothetical protein
LYRLQTSTEVKGLPRILTVALIINLLVMSACNRHLAVVNPVVIHDTITTSVNTTNSTQDIPGVPDSSYIVLMLKCDSLDNIYIKTVTQLQGEIIKQSLKLQENELTVNAKSQTREKKEVVRKDSIITVQVEKPVPYPVETITNKLTSWQSFQIWVGRIVLIALFVFLIVKFAGNKLSFITNLFK